MGFLDRLLGRDEERPQEAAGAGAVWGERGTAGAPTKSADEIAVERYRYLLRTAPPETIEQVHTEAFGKLTSEQRALVFDELSRSAPAGDAPADESPAALARSATRSELRQPGLLEKAFAGSGGAAGGAAGVTGAAGAGGYGRQAAGGGGGVRGIGVGGMGFGSMFAGSLLGSVAGFVIGSAIAQAFIPDDIGMDQTADANETDTQPDGGADTANADSGDSQSDAGADAGETGAADSSADDPAVLADGGDYSTDQGDDFGGDAGSDFGSDFGGDAGSDFGGDMGF